MRRSFFVAAVALFLFAALNYGVGEILSRPVLGNLGPPPAGLPTEPVVINVPSAPHVAGWFVRGTPGQGAVLLLHGVRSNRGQMLARAQFLHAAGYAVLLIDLQAHGESGGERITFGYREANGVVAAMQFLRQTLPGERVGVIGVSLGAASLVLADVQPAPDAVVLESMYPTIAEAVADRLQMRLGAVSRVLAPVLLWQLPLRLDISAEQLRPIDHLPQIKAPVLIASGTEDQQTPVAETRRLFATAAEPKALWLVDGAAHVDLHKYDPAAYEAKIGAFLSSTLRWGN